MNTNTNTNTNVYVYVYMINREIVELCFSTTNTLVGVHVNCDCNWSHVHIVLRRHIKLVLCIEAHSKYGRGERLFWLVLVRRVELVVCWISDLNMSY